MTQKRGLGRGLGALIPGAGTAPATGQDLRTRSHPRTSPEAGEKGASSRPVDMFFSGDPVQADEQRPQRDRASKQDIAGEMARAAAERRGRAGVGTGRASTAKAPTAAKATAAKATAAKAATGKGGAAEDAQDAPDAPTSTTPAKKAPAKRTPAKKAPAKSAPTKSAPAKSNPTKSTPAEKAVARKPSVTEAPVENVPAADVPVAESPAEAPTESTGPVAENSPVVDVEKVTSTPVSGTAEADTSEGTASEATAAEPSTPATSTTETSTPEPTPQAAPSDHDELSKPEEDPRAAVQDGALLPVPGAEFAEVPIHEIRENPRNPRTMFDEDELDELAESLQQVGVLQPVVVRPISVTEDGESFELVMGERRWRAARRAGLDRIPAIIRETSDDDLLRDALLENLHRSQLNPLEEAAAYQQLLEDFGCTQDELAERIGRSRPQITNTLRLMRLPALVQRRLASGAISAGHARALLSLDDPALMEELAQRIVQEGLSVRAVERLVARGVQPAAATRTPRRSTYDPHVVDLTSRLSNRLEAPVRIDVGKRKGKITLEFSNLEDLERLVERIGLDLPEGTADHS